MNGNVSVIVYNFVYNVDSDLIDVYFNVLRIFL